MKISVIGSGYVGSVTAACFAEVGHEVVCVDIDKKKMEQINAGIPPIYEEGLGELLRKYAGKRLIATNDYESAIRETDISFICVGTPSAEDGSIDLSIVRAATASIGAALAKKERYHVVVVKSTVVPETTEKFVLPVLEETSGKIAGKDFGVAMNPEFLREGKAVYDFMHPDKIVIGAIDQKSGDLVSELYRTFECKVTRSNPSTAEMIKYANNSLLATKISFANEIGNICKKLGVDTYEVMEAVGKDSRISPKFLNSGAGFGGSCFPKDVKALIGKAKEIGYSPILLESVIGVNEKQPLLMIEILQRKIGDLKGKKITLLGLAFKNETDDIRESRSIPVIAELLRLGAKVSAYDPMATANMKRIFPTIEYSGKAKDALESADACLVMTEWDEFKQLESEFAAMKGKVVIDGRRVIKAKSIDYEGLCW
ncbi:UDP-glucose/GDP-mannose dehydrogenase family protein [Methanosarcina sp. Z-7115]|uniref:UDP-glucose 6-dehydrogenase n=1 Tax=Methanosarcina baikalica TaxID=3073890 RepID=A0ABU2CXY2_9EURY|nr:UDP-glucose/GDP-mannose dehydrogenase family protein [Methanosarcina sp. Z-7115]MDR7664589.1 UDP-glucose/GDP-mannose dehydrogenase family protein [Methanosarcina sp. Z-7115]